MSRRAAIPAGLAMLAMGFLLGVAFTAGTWVGSVHADPAPRNEADRVYDELGGDRNPLAESSRVLAKISAVATPSVVHILSERKNERRGVVEETGSGVIVAHPRNDVPLIVTNRHVVASPSTPDNKVELSSISIHLYDGRILNPTKLVTDKATDLALLQLPSAAGLQPARLADSDAAQIGNVVLAMGSPFGLSRSVTFGIISAKGRRSLKLGSDGSVLNQDFLQTDAAINPGNSGGPLIDLQGRVVGINTAIASNSGGNDGIGFSIPSNLVKQVMDQLIEHGRVQRSYLGVKLNPDFDLNAAQRLKLDRNRGAHVVEVYPNTPASRANLQFDDVVLAFDGIDVQDENHLINLVSLTPVGRTIRLVVHREGKRVNVSVLLADRSELEQRSQTSERPGIGVPIRNMGLSVHSLDRTIARQLGYRENQSGVVVLSIDENSPLSQELHLYDVIQEVGRVPVRTVSELQQQLDAHQDSRTVMLKVQRHENDRLVERVIVWNR